MNPKTNFLYYRATSPFGGMLVAPTMAELNSYIINGAKNPMAVYKRDGDYIAIPIVNQMSDTEIREMYD